MPSILLCSFLRVMHSPTPLLSFTSPVYFGHIKHRTTFYGKCYNLRSQGSYLRRPKSIVKMEATRESKIGEGSATVRDVGKEAEGMSDSIASALNHVRRRMAAISLDKPGNVQLVAVSKTKPVPLLLSAYNAGQRHFGENYVQELVQKSTEMADDVLWHYIGPLQSNKAKVLLSVRNLYMVETVDREKIAIALDRAAESAGRASRLKVLVQVNTSGEESKSGCQPGETIDLVKAVQNCQNLEFAGLMTIGAQDDSDEPIAFRILREERDKVADAIGVNSETLTLSMGMSNDFEAAIRMGSNSVRIGSTIFGAREYPNK